VINILWRRSTVFSQLVTFLLLLLAVVLTLLPFAWAAINSIKTSTATFEPGAFIPFVSFEPTLDSWREVLDDPQVTDAFVSSIVVSLGTTVFALILGVPAAYALARSAFRSVRARSRSGSCRNACCRRRSCWCRSIS